MKSVKTLAALFPFALFATAALLPACVSYDCVEYACSDLTPNPLVDQTVNICDRGDGYVRLDDESGEELYECFCDVDLMKSAAAKICSEGAVCRKAGSFCETSGDCCAGHPCTFNVCG
jgi:hypothetical protein